MIVFATVGEALACASLCAGARTVSPQREMAAALDCHGPAGTASGFALVATHEECGTSVSAWLPSRGPEVSAGRAVVESPTAARVSSTRLDLRHFRILPPPGTSPPGAPLTLRI